MYDNYMRVISETAWCSGHQAMEPIEGFGSAGKRGLQSSCKASRKEHYAANREAYAVRNKEHRENNRGAAAAYQKAYREENRAAYAAYQKEYRDAHQEDLAAYHKGYYERNREAVLSHVKERREANPEAVAVYQKAYQKANRLAIIAQHKEWCEANPEKVNSNAQRRRALELNVAGSFTAGELKALYESCDYRCLCCGQREGDVSSKDGSPIKLTADHIIPLSWPGSSNSIDNIQPLCFPCNSSKGARRATDYRLIQ